MVTIELSPEERADVLLVLRARIAELRNERWSTAFAEELGGIADKISSAPFRAWMAPVQK